MDNKPLFFDHDYPSEVVKKRKAYTGIKKVLKKNGINFQTPMTKIKIHWQDGTKIYDNPQDAVQEMQEKGLEVEMGEGDQEDAVYNRIKEVFQWERIGDPPVSTGARQRAKQRLQEFRRGGDSTKDGR